MQDKVQLTLNGQELRIGDFNTVAAEAAKADDVVLAEILRMAPFDGTTVTRGILPVGYSKMVANVGMVYAVAGGLNIGSFRAVVGSRTPVGTSAVDNTLDIRSATYVQPTGGVAVALPVGAGTARVHLVYATLYVDKSAGATSRLFKDPTSTLVTPTSVNPLLQTYVTLGVVSITMSGGTLPTIPADPTGGYNIPLAYVRTPSGYTAGSGLNSNDVIDVSPVLRPFRANAAPANKTHNAGSALCDLTSWATAYANGRPATYMPAAMVSHAIRLLPVQLTLATSPGTAPASGSIVDDSLDWRGRVFKVTYQVTYHGGAADPPDFAWNSANPMGMPTVINNGGSGSSILPIGTQLSNTLAYDNAVATSRVVVLSIDANNASSILLSGAQHFRIECDTSGRLVIDYSLNAQDYYIFVWIEAVGPFANQ